MSRPDERYENLKTKKLANGRTVYAPSRPKVIETTDLDPVVIADERDRMDTIAKNVFGTAQDWWKIAAANRNVNGSIHFKPGKKVIIPK